MKNIFKYITAVVALLVGFTASGQTQSGLNVDKKVTDNGDGSYTLELETFVTGKSTSKSSVKPINAILVLDMSGSMNFSMSGSNDNSKERLNSLKASATSFANTLIANAIANQVDHKIAIVTFANSSNTKLSWTSLKDNGNSAIDAIASLSATGATRSDYGLNTAKGLIGNNVDPDATNLLVMFTDGVPTSIWSSAINIFAEDFDYSVSASAINHSLDIKNKGYSVYTIGIFEDDDANNMSNYMNAVSSNYPKATATAWSFAGWSDYSKWQPGTQSDTKYFAQVSNATELSKVFETIAGEAIASSDEKRGVDTKAEIYDEITADFLIPRSDSGSIDKNNIVIKCADVKSISNWSDESRSNWVFEWKGERVPTSADGDIKVSLGTKDGKDYVSVTGFDFQSNWCGPVVENGVLKGGNDSFHGSKLIIRITIVQNPNSDGGALTTNTGDSGIYVNDVQLNPSFPVPSTAATEYKVTVKNNSLQNGDSAVYTITRSLNGVVDSSYKLQLILTSDTSVAGISNEKSVKLRLFKGSDENAKYKYTVTETLWNWTYSKSKASLEAVVADQISGLSGPYVFDFSGGTKNDVKIKNVEKTY